MDWNATTERLLGFLPQPGAEIGSITRYTWEIGSRIKDGLVELEAEAPDWVYVRQEDLIFEWNLSETVLVRVVVQSTQIIIWAMHEGSLKLKTMFDAPFEVLEQLTKGIVSWLHNLLKSSTTAMRRAQASSGGE